MRYLFLIFALFGCSSLQLTTMGNSIHYDSASSYTQKHDGIGVRAKIKDGLFAELIHYTNSYNAESRMVLMSQEVEIYEGLYTGPIIGVADGYDEYAFFGGFAIRYGITRIVFTPVVAVGGLVIGFK